MKGGGLILWNAIAIYEMTKSSWQTGKRSTKDDLENHLKGQYYLLEQWLNIIRLLRNIRSRIHQCGKKVLPGIFDSLTADLEDLETLDASDIYPRWIKAKGVLISQKDDEFVFPVADGTANLSGRGCKFRAPTLKRKQTTRSEDLSVEFQSELEESQPAEPTDDAEARGDFWSIRGDVIYRHHTEPRVQLHVPKEETFPIPLKYNDVTGSTHADLDVNDYWNVDSCKHVSDSWRGFTKFTLLKENPSSTQQDTCGPGKEIDKDSNNFQTFFDVWPEVWTKIGKAAQNREKQAWAKEKPNLDNARTLRGIFFIHPDDQESSEFINKRKKKTGKTHGCSHALQARQTAFQHRENE